MQQEGTVRKPVTVASAAPDDEARPFAVNPSIAAPRRSQRTDHELVGENISVQWVYNDDDELDPATALNVERYGDKDAVKDLFTKSVDAPTQRHLGPMVSGKVLLNPVSLPLNALTKKEPKVAYKRKSKM